MDLGKIVDEWWDEKLGGLTWKRELGIETTVFQAQGLDIVLKQTRDGKDHHIWNYSEPGLFLYAALLNYHRTVCGHLPPLEDIQHIFGKRYAHRESGFPVDRIGMNSIMSSRISRCIGDEVVQKDGDDVLVVGSHMGGRHYGGFIEDDAFIICSQDGPGKKVKIFYEKDGKKCGDGGKWRKTIVLLPDDAVRVMKTIYFFFDDHNFMDGAYRQAAEPRKNWIHAE